MPKSKGSMWTEEYANALDAFNISTSRLRLAVEKVLKENKWIGDICDENARLQKDLEEARDLYAMAENVIEAYGMRDDPD